MNRRKALEILAAIPVGSIAAVNRVQVRPNEVIVIEIAHRLTERHIKQIRETVNEIFAHTKVIVLCDGATLRVVREAD